MLSRVLSVHLCILTPVCVLSILFLLLVSLFYPGLFCFVLFFNLPIHFLMLEKEGVESDGYEGGEDLGGDDVGSY